VCANDLSPH